MNNRKTSQGFAKLSIKILKYVIMLVVTVACATTAYSLGSKVFSNEAMEAAPGTDMSFTFAKGTTVKEVGETLEEYQVIDDANIFQVQSYIYGVKKIKKGTYLFNTSQSSEEIFKTIAAGPEEKKKNKEKETTGANQ